MVADDILDVSSGDKLFSDDRCSVGADIERHIPDAFDLWLHLLFLSN
jgi:hypothetical protein